MLKPYQHQPLSFVAIYYIDNVVKLIDSMNGQGHLLLRKARISPQSTQNLNDKITLKQYIRLLNFTENVAQSASIGLLLARNVNITGHGSLGFAVMSSPTIEVAIRLIAQYIALLSPLMSIKIVTTTTEVKIQFHESTLLNNAKRIYLDMVTCTTIKVLRFISSTDIKINQLSFNFKAPSFAIG